MMPVHMSALNGYTECVKKFLTSETEIDVTDGRGRTALHCAACSGNIACLDLLLSAGNFYVVHVVLVVVAAILLLSATLLLLMLSLFLLFMLWFMLLFLLFMIFVRDGILSVADYNSSRVGVVAVVYFFTMG